MRNGPLSRAVRLATSHHRDSERIHVRRTVSSETMPSLSFAMCTPCD